jgi:hypothetical protein
MINQQQLFTNLSRQVDCYAGQVLSSYPRESEAYDELSAFLGSLGGGLAMIARLIHPLPERAMTYATSTLESCLPDTKKELENYEISPDSKLFTAIETALRDYIKEHEGREQGKGRTPG